MILAGILSPLENALAWGLRHLHDPVGFSWGWSIVALTLIVRVALVPLMVKQIHSMQSLQRHMPEMKAIQAKYKGDRAKTNEETMKFYKENNINPAASCLPMLVQFPVFIALYFVLRNFTRHIHGVPSHELGWLIVPNITEKITHHWSGWVLLVLYVISQVGYGYFGIPPTTPKAQRALFMVMPIFIAPVIVRFPVGLLLYWMTTNLWTVGQGVVTRRLVPAVAVPPKRSSRSAPKEAVVEPAAVTEPKPAAAPGPPRRVKRKKKRGGR